MLADPIVPLGRFGRGGGVSGGDFDGEGRHHVRGRDGVFVFAVTAGDDLGASPPSAAVEFVAVEKPYRPRGSVCCGCTCLPSRSPMPLRRVRERRAAAWARPLTPPCGWPP